MSTVLTPLLTIAPNFMLFDTTIVLVFIQELALEYETAPVADATVLVGSSGYFP